MQTRRIWIGRNSDQAIIDGKIVFQRGYWDKLSFLKTSRIAGPAEVGVVAITHPIAVRHEIRPNATATALSCGPSRASSESP